jgi:S-adenosylmethionine:diacylglycerol 3-amino-3-carboxypropyl transferase
MSVLFDFGISQEDPYIEKYILNIQPGDRILSLAGAGEVSLSLLSMVNDIQIKAVDISENQIKLCRLKLFAALFIDFPLNGQFLGYSNLDGKKRIELYKLKIRHLIPDEDVLFWDKNLSYIEKGVVNTGRFEQYVKKMRFFASLFIGSKNLQHLIESKSPDEQKEIFQKCIASRKSLQILFRIAFHPTIYKKRGLRKQAIIHTGSSTRERFFKKFEDFCTTTPASKNYFLQYLLTGNCITKESYPQYLQPENLMCLRNNLNNFELVKMSLQDALFEKEKGHYTKIHLSNLGDWLSEEQFMDLLTMLNSNCNQGTIICYRYLQKNYFQENRMKEFTIDYSMSEKACRNDRFPFYNILSVTLNSEFN